MTQCMGDSSGSQLGTIPPTSNNWGTFGNIWRNFDCCNWGQEVATGIKFVQVTDGAKYQTMHKIAPYNKELSSLIYHTAKTEKSS